MIKVFEYNSFILTSSEFQYSFDVHTGSWSVRGHVNNLTRINDLEINAEGITNRVNGWRTNIKSLDGEYFEVRGYRFVVQGLSSTVGHLSKSLKCPTVDERP